MMKFKKLLKFNIILVSVLVLMALSPGATYGLRPGLSFGSMGVRESYYLRNLYIPQVLTNVPMSERLQKILLGELKFESLSFDDSNAIVRELISLLPLDSVLKSEELKYILIVAIRLDELNIRSYHVRKFFTQHLDALKQDPQLLQWAIIVYSHKMKNALPESDYPFIDGHHAFYRILKELLYLPYEILTDKYKLSRFAAIPIQEGHTSFDDIIQDAVHKTSEDAVFHSLDIGTAHGLVPLYMRRVFDSLSNNREKGIFVGTEIQGFWDKLPREHRQSMNAMGVSVVSWEWKIDESGGVNILLKRDLSDSRLRFNFVSWIKPPFLFHGESLNVFMIQNYLPSILDERASLLLAFSTWEPPGFYLDILLPLIESIKSNGKKVKMRMVSINPDFGEIDHAIPIGKNLSRMQLINPDENMTRPLKLLVELGEEDENSHLYLDTEDSFLAIFKKLLEIEISNASGQRRKDLQLSLRIIFQQSDRELVIPQVQEDVMTFSVNRAANQQL